MVAKLYLYVQHQHFRIGPHLPANVLHIFGLLFQVRRKEEVPYGIKTVSNPKKHQRNNAHSIVQCYVISSYTKWFYTIFAKLMAHLKTYRPYMYYQFSSMYSWKWLTKMIINLVDIIMLVVAIIAESITESIMRHGAQKRDFWDVCHCHAKRRIGLLVWQRRRS